MILSAFPGKVSKAVSYGEIFSRNICPNVLPTNISPPPDLGNMESVYGSEIFFLVFMAGSEGVSIRGRPGEQMMKFKL